MKLINVETCKKCNGKTYFMERTTKMDCNSIYFIDTGYLCMNCFGGKVLKILGIRIEILIILFCIFVIFLCAYFHI